MVGVPTLLSENGALFWQAALASRMLTETSEVDAVLLCSQQTLVFVQVEELLAVS
jgi:hypothetical protein